MQILTLSSDRREARMLPIVQDNKIGKILTFFVLLLHHIRKETLTYSKQSMLRILWISAFFFSHQTFPGWSAPPAGVVILAFLQSTQCLIFFPPKWTKQDISLFFAIWIERCPHQTVPGEGFWPPGFVSYPNLHIPQTLFISRSSKFPYHVKYYSIPHGWR